MSEQTPSLDAIYNAFSIAMQDAVAEEKAAKALTVVPPSQDISPNAKEMLLISALQPGMVGVGELGGRAAIAPRPGVWIMTISSLRSSEKIGAMWRLAEKLERTFRRMELATNKTDSGGCPVHCDEPYTTNVGETPDKRIALSVTVPWWTWTGGEGDINHG